MEDRHSSSGLDSRLHDEMGRIPAFPPLTRDESGRFAAPSEDERLIRSDVFRRAVHAIGLIHDETDDDERWREILNNLGVPTDPDPLQKSG